MPASDPIDPSEGGPIAILARRIGAGQPTLAGSPEPRPAGRLSAQWGAYRAIDGSIAELVDAT